MDPYQNTIFSEPIRKIEERVSNILNPFDLLTPRHSFIIIKTHSGRKIKLEYTHEGRAVYDFEYKDWQPSFSIRKFRLAKKVSLFRVLKKFENIAYKKPYEKKFHNCQHVCRDFFVKISNKNDCLLFSDHLAKIAKYHLFSINFNISEDEFHKDIKPEVFKEDFIRSPEISSKKIDRIMKKDPLGLLFLTELIKNREIEEITVKNKTRFLIRPDFSTKSIKREFEQNLNLYQFQKIFHPKDLNFQLLDPIDWKRCFKSKSNYFIK